VAGTVYGRCVMEPGYVFIVGLPRTGSKLVENILRNSPHINYESAGEVAYLGSLFRPRVRDKIKKLGDMSEDTNVHTLVDYFYTRTPRKGFWLRLKHVDRKRLLQELLASDRTEKGIYEVILRIHTTVTDKTILGDKTGSNLYDVPTLVKWFPQAKIIHLLRDPRAILASEWRRRMEEYPKGFYFPVKLGKPIYSPIIVLHMTISWLCAVRLHRRYEKRYPQNYHLMRFEDLVREPEKSVRELCAFLDIEFDPRMLHPKQIHSSFASEMVVGFDKQTLGRWRNHLKPWMKIWMSIFAQRYFREFGYVDGNVES
jgi:hypothetical protein